MHFSFVVPIIHPDHPRVKDYNRTLMALRATLGNLLQQTHQNISIVVCCHRKPPWHHEIDPRVHFLVMEKHPELPFQTFRVYDNEASEVDKGVKLAVGFAYASDRLKADYVMPMDADDFARADLAENVASGAMPQMGTDGWHIVRGFNLEIEAKSAGLSLRTAYEVQGFHRNCGSCRIFSSDALNRKFRSIVPRLAQLRDLVPSHADAPIKMELIEAALSDLRANTSPNGPFMIFAIHKRQEHLFNLAEVNRPLMAKGCGHSNHAGQSDIFWYRVLRQWDVPTVMRDFGLAKVSIIRAKPDPINHLRTRVRMLRGIVDQVRPSLRARLNLLFAR